MIDKQNILEIADIFRENKTILDNLSYAQENVITRIITCRTAKLGGHLLECNNDNCNYFEISYNSCQDRHCPKCQSLVKEKWIFEREQELLPVPYFHIVFTIPRILAPIALQNKEQVYGLLFKTVSETIKQVSGTKDQLDAKAGCITILHTWDQKLLHHPHLHCIVPGGGISKDNLRWISSHSSYFVPVRILSSIFRAKFLKGLEKSFRKKSLSFFNDLDYLNNLDQFKLLLAESCKTDWVVYAKRPFKNTQSVINYLGRYTHKVAISNYRLKKVVNGFVFFSYRDRKNGNQQKIMQLPIKDFMKRFLLHILPKGFRKIRYYGFLACAIKKEMINLIRSFFSDSVQETDQPEKPHNWNDYLTRLISSLAVKCPKCCSGKLHIQTEGVPAMIGSP